MKMSLSKIVPLNITTQPKWDIAHKSTTNSTNHLGVTKFKIKSKPQPIIFTSNDGPSAPKKLKLTDKLNNKPNNSQPNHQNNNPKKNVQQQRLKLPIYGAKNQLLDLIRRHNTLIVLAETGSGKTTQIPQYIYAARLQNNSCIGITQPRRVAAISVAKRVAQEQGNGQNVGDVVGYTVRFEDVTSKKTKIKYLTDGMLLREAMHNKLLLDYNFIILDEAHERTIFTDVLFGIVKNAQTIRKARNLPPLKIIVMSATMDVDHFSEYFNNCPVVYIEGRIYPVSLYYICKPPDDYQRACISTFFKFHKEAPVNHDVLIFLTGQEEIESVAYQIRDLAKDPLVLGGAPPVHVCTLYAAQSSAQQLTVFDPVPENKRKVILSTNIAETSVTISGVKCIIDCGMVKARTYHPATGLELLKVQRISQEQANQRTGRAGRESAGRCYRLYTRTQFDMLQKSTTPEIQRANLATVTLLLLALNIHTLHFDFIDKPSESSIKAAFNQLQLLGAVENPDTISLTPLGKQMAKFPLDPRFSKILLSAPDYGCLEEALTIVSLLSVESVFVSHPRKRLEVQKARERFRCPRGDHLTLLTVYNEADKIGAKNLNGWCHKHFIHTRNILQVKKVRQQLKEICERCELSFASCGNQLDKIRKCLLTGLFMNLAELQNDKKYITLDKRTTVAIHPSSELHGQLPELVLFTEIVQTSKCYMRVLTTVEGDWVQEIVPEYVRTHRMKHKSDS